MKASFTIFLILLAVISVTAKLEHGQWASLNFPSNDIFGPGRNQTTVKEKMGRFNSMREEYAGYEKIGNMPKMVYHHSLEEKAKSMGCDTKNGTDYEAFRADAMSGIHYGITPQYYKIGCYYTEKCPHSLLCLMSPTNSNFTIIKGEPGTKCGEDPVDEGLCVVKNSEEAVSSATSSFSLTFLASAAFLLF